LDRLLGGGLVAGQVAGWLTAPASGSASLMRATARRALVDGHRVAIVDAGGTLAPADWASVGGPPQARLWFVRPRPGAAEEAGRQALWAAEVLARSGAFGLVALDLTGLDVRGAARWAAP